MRGPVIVGCQSINNPNKHMHTTWGNLPITSCIRVCVCVCVCVSVCKGVCERAHMCLRESTPSTWKCVGGLMTQTNNKQGQSKRKREEDLQGK